MNNANNFSTVSIFTGRNVTLNDTGTLTLGASTVSGTLNVTTAGLLDQSAAVTVTGVTTLAAGAANNITLDTATNDFGTVAITSGNNVTLMDANAIDLGASTVSGNLAVTAGQSITDSGILNVTGTSTFTAGVGFDILLDQPTHVLTGAITINPAVGLRHVSITRTTALDLPALTLTGNLSVTAAGITQAGALVVPGTTTLTSTGGADILLANAGNNFGTLGASGANVTIVDANAINLTTSTVTGNLTVTATAGGDITDSGALKITGNSTFTVAAGRSILLDHLTHTFGGAVTLNPANTLNNVSLTDTTPLNLAALTLTGNLSVTAAGITQAGALVVPGTTTLTSAGGNDILLANDGNNFNSVSIVSGNNVTLVDANAVVLGSYSVTGNFSLTTGGAITQTGPLTVGGTTTLAAGAANNITLGNASNNFTGAVSVLSGNSVTLVDANDILIDRVTVSELTIGAGGSITDATNEQGRISATTKATLAAGTAIGSQAEPFDISTCDLTHVGLGTGRIVHTDSCAGVTKTIGGGVDSKLSSKINQAGFSTGSKGSQTADLSQTTPPYVTSTLSVRTAPRYDKARHDDIRDRLRDRIADLITFELGERIGKESWAGTSNDAIALRRRMEDLLAQMDNEAAEGVYPDHDDYAGDLFAEYDNQTTVALCASPRSDGALPFAYHLLPVLLFAFLLRGSRRTRHEAVGNRQ